MFAKVRVTGKNEETFLPRVLRVLAKQGVHIRSLHLDAEADVVKLEVLLVEAAAAQVAKLLAKQMFVSSVETVE
ncbi:MAG: hypothetical protein J6B49_01365 [Phascolarctobacterium sp.]|nr:hypothetical protein [Phascolarctobacterium sp.]MBQ8691166.1 hypothetical protein [Phascolarctobacterium sp.]MBR2039748.1 hypothetical protein [Phascolarctobacterium sp.]MBR2071416.1 hypothetical protein [Phascolarctobacterium sp.]MBR2139749.1 hypothetical protein [Phascolarctobacterium sp.]